MKHILKLISFGAICAGLALSQPTPPDPTTMAQRQVEHLTQRLSLTTDQQTQATTIFTNAITANQAAMASLHQAHTSLATAIKSNDTASITSLTAQIGTLQGQSLANMAKAEAAFYAILTPDQQAKYNPGRGFGGPGMGPANRGRFGAHQ